MENRNVHDSTMTFYFPFSYRQSKFKQLIEKVEQKGYSLFQLEPESKLTDELEQFFYPFVQEKVLPNEVSEHALNRFVQTVHVAAVLQTRHRAISFTVERLDIVVCPFETGILSVVVTLQESLPLNDVIDFMRDFRQLVPELEQKKYLTITVEDKTLYSTEQLLYEYLIPFLPSFFIQDDKKAGYIGSLPFFEDERMYTTCLLLSDEASDIEAREMYKLAHLDGRNKDGSNKISSFNDAYIEQYIDRHSYLRWAPHIYVTTTMQSQVALSNVDGELREDAKRYFLSTSYYNILVHYFYKIVLLKLSYEHSEIKWSTDKIIAESLSEKITLFSSKYYFQQIAIRSSGRDLSRYIRQQMRINELFVEVKQSVTELYRVLEEENQDRYNQLLFILTVYTVISGIIGMNLVIEDWEKPIDWGNLNYSFFEWVAFITGVTGIWLSFMLIVGAAIRFIVNYVRKKNH